RAREMARGAGAVRGRAGVSRADLLIEIGVEEVPARMLGAAADDLAARVVGVLGGAGLAHGDAKVFATPRRLAVQVAAVETVQVSREEEITGPPAAAAKGPDGKPTKAAIGFAQKMGVDLAALAVLSTPRGDYLGVRRHVAGRAAAELIAEALPRQVTSMAFPKTMRWGDGTRRSVRPVHWIVALLGEAVVPLEIFAIRAGRESAGHRILGARTVAIGAPSDYESALLAPGVVADRHQRRRAPPPPPLGLAGGG